ncbi:MAG: hypothetical protein B6242_09990 [Anaerolineaceae bacterium 4572_78]|nr:MAG: hypothetical protein B6242_09990 [Anaerolineaceae bacterium 4572_78]
MSIRILLVDDHAVLRTGLTRLLDDEPDMQVVGEASNGREAQLLIDKKCPDVVITDISMPELNGIEGVRVWRQSYPNLKVIILSMHANREYVSRALQVGAKGYVPKHAVVDEVVQAVRVVMAGKAYLSPSISQYVIDGYLVHASSTETFGPNLTTREREVAQLIAEGQSTRQIAEMLYVSVKTVETHRINIMRKLDTKNQADIIKYTIKMGWITLD